MRKFCIACGRPFQAPRQGRGTCSRSCAGKSSSRRWGDAEIEYLDERFGYMPLPNIIEGYLRAAKKNRWPERSYAAVLTFSRKRAARTNVSVRPQLDNYSVKFLANFLEVGPRRVDYWCTRYGLKRSKVTSTQYKIRQSDLNEWMEVNAHRVSDIPAYLLEAVTDDPALVARVKATPLQRVPRARPVVCVQTGQRFPHMAAAEKTLSFGKGTLCRALKNGTRCGGYEWRFIERAS